VGDDEPGEIRFRSEVTGDAAGYYRILARASARS
jgi:hypothetical protein